ncbi:MAG: FxsA family protein [Clostridia bacterium]|nr:FxsA family protein [Clostridia bacterium]
MLFWLILCFTVLPVLELWLLIELGGAIGTWPTILLVLGTGAAGAFFAKTQGFFLFHRIVDELRRGNLPGWEMVNGLCVLLGGILLITPGLLTDAAGLFLLIPLTRRLLVELIRRWLAAKLQTTGFYFHYSRPEDPGAGYRGEDDEW